MAASVQEYQQKMDRELGEIKKIQAEMQKLMQGKTLYSNSD